MPVDINQEKARLAALSLLGAMTEAISASPDGIPSGHLYAVLMGKCSLQTYNAVIDSLVNLNFITNKGHLLQATDSGREFAKKMGGYHAA